MCIPSNSPFHFQTLKMLNYITAGLLAKIFLGSDAYIKILSLWSKGKQCPCDKGNTTSICCLAPKSSSFPFDVFSCSHRWVGGFTTGPSLLSSFPRFSPSCQTLPVIPVSWSPVRSQQVPSLEWVAPHPVTKFNATFLPCGNHVFPSCSFS